MKARIIRPDMRPSKRYGGPVDGGCIPEGTVIDDPHAFMLVRMGVAVPADDECEAAAAMSPEAMARAQYAYERQVRGIAPKDFERYDNGEISHVLPDGSYAPGPNYKSSIIIDGEDDE